LSINAQYAAADVTLELVSPAPGSTLTDGNVTFGWSAAGVAVNK
jgi:hypothetical protein